ncbi:MAG: DinB family protein, partial [bacterium]|nr:DinB family protein [bacterium]
KWSIIQVLSHLAVAEKASLAGVRKMTDDPARLGKTGLAGWARSTVLQLALRMPFKIKAPARAATVPERQDLETTRRQWDEVRVGWRETLEAFPDELLDRTIFMHPVVGPLSLTQGLRFMEDHLDRHAKQIDRIVGR